MEGIFCNCCLRALHNQVDYSVYPGASGDLWLCRRCYEFVTSECSRAIRCEKNATRELSLENEGLRARCASLHATCEELRTELSNAIKK